MDEVTVFTTRAAIRSMVVAAGHRAEITRLNELILLKNSLLSHHLIQLSQLLHSSLLVLFLELHYLLIGKCDENLRRLTGRLLKQATNLLFLLYRHKRKC